MWTEINSGFGAWEVYSWLIFFGIASFFVLWLRSVGRKDYKKGTDQDEIFYGGNPVPEDGAELAIPASSAYWGFTKALKPYYERLVALHTGIASDYVGWLVLTGAVLAVLVVLIER
jgi:hypothetical protein